MNPRFREALKIAKEEKRQERANSMIVEVSTRWRQRGKEHTQDARLIASASTESSGLRYVQIVLAHDQEQGRPSYLNVYLDPESAENLGKQLLGLSRR